MPFTIIAYDHKDTEAPARRQQHREAHLALISKLKEEGKAILGCPLLDDDKRMIGSLIVFDFADREELDAYMEGEPYIAGNVWGDIQILPCDVAPAWKK